MMTKHEYKLELLKIKARREAAERRLSKTKPISAEDMKWLREMQARIPEETKKRLRAKMMSGRLKAAWPAA